MHNQANDGIDHINVYSAGKTWLGQYLSNFAICNIETEDGPFATIEGYWYWLSAHDDRLRTLNGFQCKKLGRELLASDWLNEDHFRDKILKAMAVKIYSNERCLRELLNSTLPFTHYYVYGSKVIDVPKAYWMLEFIEFIRNDLKSQNSSIPLEV